MPVVSQLGEAEPVFDVPNVRPTGAMRVATLNLVTAKNQSGFGPVTNVISVTPRINGDGSLMLQVEWNAVNNADKSGTSAVTITTVKDGETLAVSMPNRHTSVVVRPMVVK